MRPSPGIRAFVDESFRARHGSVDGIYLLSAVMLPVDRVDAVREVVEDARPRDVARFHWREDRDDVRRLLLDRLEDLGGAALTLHLRGVPRRGIERARQHGLWSLVHDLVQADVSDVVFEARERTQNERDARTLRAISRSRMVDEDFSHRFAGPFDESLLWLADYVAGAAGNHLVYDDSEGWNALPAAWRQMRRTSVTP